MKPLLKSLALFAAFIMSLTTMAQADGLSGHTVLVTNMFKGNSTKNVETDVAAFGLKNNLFATTGDGLEFPRFITLYDINIEKDAVSFNWVESDFSEKVGGPMPEDKHDRNYFVIDLPEGQEITSVTFDKEGSKLHEGSALPTVTLISRNKFMTEFANGVIRKAGFAPRFKVTIAPKGS